ncbi:MAG: alpha/beta fold hydrolase [Thermoanaerobaculia bacterium]|nr:alpha/beta fold hydrolase [Thermoanaerobaculia bacterium]
MAARTTEEEQKRRRRKLLVRGLLLGGAAVGVPALVNALVSRRVRDLKGPSWGRSSHYAWQKGEIAFQRLGQGEPLVLLHSFGPGHDSEEWRAAAERLAGSFEVFAPDLLGWGRSEKPPLAYDGVLYLQLIADFLEDVVQRRAVVAAAGLPAAYAVQVAVDHPERVRGLALSVPSGLNQHADEPDLRDALLHRTLGLPILGTYALNLYTSHANIARHLRREVFSRPDRVDAALVERHYRSSHQPGAQRPLSAYLAGYLNHRVDDALARLDLPLWLAWGREARSPAVETADLWLLHAPGAELEVFDGCGNLPHAEVAAPFCQRLEGFLSGRPA